MARLGIDLSGDFIAMADVRQAGTRLQLRGYALLNPIPDRTLLMEALRRAREEHRFPLTAEVVAWAGEPRVSAVRAAGYGIERVILPGEALARVARLRHGLDAQPTGEAFALVSLDPTSGTMAIVRDSTVLYEAPLTWSSNAAPGPSDAKGAVLLRRYAFLFEITELLHAAFTAARESHHVRVSKILMCGCLPDLRSLTVPLAEEFAVDVEPLDSTGALDLRRVKGHSREEAEAAIPALQLAIVASRRWHRSHSPVKRMLRIAVPLGVAAAAYGIYAGGSPGSRNPGTPGAADSSRSPRPTAPPVPSAPVGSVLGGLPGAPPPPPPPRQASRPPGPAQSEAPSGAPSAVAPVSLSLTSILYSPDRQLAIIEGQVLGVGDTVAGMKIVEIRPDAVILRDRAGRLRRVALARPRPEDSSSPGGH
jgi:hypothetical protein